jgi:hypothetical protein
LTISCRLLIGVPDDLSALHPLSYSGSPQANASPAQRHRRDRPTASQLALTNKTSMAAQGPVLKFVLDVETKVHIYTLSLL